MFGRRPDGVRVKANDMIEQIAPHFMPMRCDAMNFITHPVRCEDMDKWISEKSEREGIRFNYMHIVMAAIVRLIAERPVLNRFVMRGALYQRKRITISLTIKKELKDDGESATLKIPFTGRETIYEVKEKVDKIISDNINSKGGTEEFAGKIGGVPNFLCRWAINALNFLDRRGMVPGSILDGASPFHTSCYVTYLKSVKTDAIYHHVYNFGTTGLFVAIGKEKYAPVVEYEELKVGKVMNLGFTMDERFTDGFYFAKSLRVLDRKFHNLQELEVPYEITDPVLLKQEQKDNKKAGKRQKKVERKIRKATKKAQKKAAKQNKMAA